ncbi:hypothetical protein BJX68DRAFT_270252 [Aspergillus pseudodeflectus]|uniref:Uncharacterized protein n=1 Tax=Aspergillus pseudodeflectus TaxID=176178 RepID=A0ABR4JT77_9EURO
MCDPEVAIREAQGAVGITPANYPDLGAMLNNLAAKLSHPYNRTGKMDDLEEDIRKAQRAVNITPVDHPDLTGRLSNLAAMLSHRYSQLLEQTDRDAYIASFLEAYNIENARPYPSASGSLGH